MPEFSIVIPSYNHAAYIAEAVQSVLDQTERDLELIIVDDGSTDNSLEVISAFSDARIRIFSQANHGAHAAINRGLKEATGVYLAILNSDDAYYPQRLEKVKDAFLKYPGAGLVGSYIEIINSNGKFLGIKHGYEDCPPWLLDSPERSFRAGTDLRAALLTENYWSTTSNFVITREIYQRIGDFRPLRYAHDWDYALRIARSAAMILLPEALLRYRVHPRNTIRENQAAMIFEICWILAVHLPQHIADKEFFNARPLDERVDQLLNSIYTYGLERVLNVMLAQELHCNPELALQLLNPGDPVRNRYLDFITRQLTLGQADNLPQTAEALPKSLKKYLNKILARLGLL